MGHRLSVQQQIEERKSKMLSLARYWRNRDLPDAVKAVLDSHQISPKSVAVIGQIDGCDLGNLSSISLRIITSTNRIIQCEVEWDPNEKLKSVVEFIDVTAQFNFESHIKGIGVGDGALAIEVLHEITSHT